MVGASVTDSNVVLATLPQVVLAHALLQWPYLSDMTLVSAITSVFHNEWGLAPQLPPSWLQLKRLPWLYFNLVLTDSQVSSSVHSQR